MSRETNYGVMIKCKAVTEILFTVVGLPPKPNWTDIAITGTPLHTSLSIRQPSMSVTPIRTTIPPSLQLNLLRIRTTNISNWSSSDRDIWYRADLWIARKRTGIFESPTGIHSAFIRLVPAQDVHFSTRALIWVHFKTVH